MEFPTKNVKITKPQNIVTVLYKSYYGENDKNAKITKPQNIVTVLYKSYYRESDKNAKITKPQNIVTVRGKQHELKCQNTLAHSPTTLRTL